MRESTETEIMRLVKVIHLRLEQYVNEIMSAYGVTAAQLDVLQYVVEHQNPDMISTDVHREMHLSKANISNIIKKLRVKGFLEFDQNPSDDRQKRIVVTDRAKCLDRELEQRFDSMKTKLYHDFTPEERQQLNCLLQKMFLNLNPGKEEGREII